MGGTYVGGNVKGIDGTLGVGPGNALVSFKARDRSDKDLLKAIKSDMHRLADLDPATIRGTDNDGFAWKLPPGPTRGRVLVVGVPQAQASYVISPEFIQELQQAAEETKTIPIVRAVRFWTGRTR